jgi:hypothetical protein
MFIVKDVMVAMDGDLFDEQNVKDEWNLQLKDETSTGRQIYPDWFHLRDKIFNKQKIIVN